MFRDEHKNTYGESFNQCSARQGEIPNGLDELGKALDELDCGLEELASSLVSVTAPRPPAAPAGGAGPAPSERLTDVGEKLFRYVRQVQRIGGYVADLRHRLEL